MFRSTDNGASWTAASTGLTSADVYDLATCGTTVFVSVHGTAFRSADDGITWALVAGLTTTNVYAFTVSGTTVFAGADGGVFRSSDQGSTWVAIGDGLPDMAVISLQLCGTNLMAGTSGRGVWRYPLN